MDKDKKQPFWATHSPVQEALRVGLITSLPGLAFGGLAGGVAGSLSGHTLGGALAGGGAAGLVSGGIGGLAQYVNGKHGVELLKDPEKYRRALQAEKDMIAAGAKFDKQAVYNIGYVLGSQFEKAAFSQGEADLLLGGAGALIGITGGTYLLARHEANKRRKGIKPKTQLGFALQQDDKEREEIKKHKEEK